MRYNRSRFYWILLLFCFINVVHAQKFSKKKRYWSFGGSLNTMNYVGDMDPYNFFISPALAYTRWNFGACALYRYNSRTSFRGSLAYGRLEGNDRKTQSPDYANESYWRFIRGTNFRNDILEVKVDVVLDLLENRGKYNKRVKYTPYVFLGLNYFWSNPMANYGEGYQPLINKVPSEKSFFNHQIAIPFGVGMRWKLSKQLDLAVEMGWRKTFTGYLDGVKGDYANPQGLSSEQRLYDNPSMVGYGSDPEVTRAINKQGIVPIDLTTGELIGNGQIYRDSPEDLRTEILNNGSVDPSHEIIFSPVGFNYYSIEDKSYNKGSDFADWYIVFGIHLTYILPERVQCPKFRN